MINKLCDWIEHWSFWFAAIFTAMLMEATALYFQYGLEKAPCELCIHVRAYLLLVLLTGVLGFIWNLRARQQQQNGNIFLYCIGLTGLLGMLYSSHQAVLIETGQIISYCSIDAGFPVWLPLDRILPSLFMPTGMCGQITEFAYGYSLNEVTIIATLIMIIVSTVLILMNCFKPVHSR